MDPIEQLADIDQFSFDYDTYEYRDQVDNREDALRELTATLHGGMPCFRDWLQEFADENEPGKAVPSCGLIDPLDQLCRNLTPTLKMADEAMAMGVDTARTPFKMAFRYPCRSKAQPSAEAQEAL